MPVNAVSQEGEIPLPPGVEERFLESGGIRFRYLASTPSTAPTAPPLLLIHGFMARAEVWYPCLHAWSSDRIVIMPDLPGHHRSSPLPGTDRTIPAYRKALGAFVDALGWPTFDVVGNSLGGCLAAMIAVDCPTRVRRLVLLDASGTTPKLPGKTVRLYFPFVLACNLFAPSEARFRRFMAKGVFHDPAYIDEAWVRWLAREWQPKDRRRAYLATANAMRRPDASVHSLLPKVGCPTLIMWGRDDAHFDWRDGEQAARAIPSARFNILESCGHVPMIEKWRETGAAVTAHLAGSPVATPP